MSNVASSTDDILGLRTEIPRDPRDGKPRVAKYGRSHYEELAAMEAYDRLCDAERELAAIGTWNRLHDGAQERWPAESSDSVPAPSS